MLFSILESGFLLAGMPSPLPDDFRALPIFSGSIRQRLESISFFLFAFLCMTVFVQFLWEFVGKRFPQAPSSHAIQPSPGFRPVARNAVCHRADDDLGGKGIADPRCLEKTGWTYSLPPEEPPINKKATLDPSSLAPQSPEAKQGDV